MKSRLRFPVASHRLSLLGLVFGASLLAAPAAMAQAPVIYGLGTVTPNVFGQPVGAQGLVIINPANGQTNTLTPPAITGVTAGQTLVGMDYRPNTGQLLALGYDAATTGPNSQLYVLNPATSVATPINATAIRLELGGINDRIGFDFNPTVDRIRVTSTNDANYRLNPNNGAVAATDPNLNPAAPSIGAVAYTNSYAGSTSTTLYDIDETTGTLYTQNPANAGTLTNATTITVDIPGGPFPLGSPRAIDFDVYFNAAANGGLGANQAYLVEVTAFPNPPNTTSNAGSSNIYSFDLATGTATNKQNVVPSSVPFEIRDIAVATPALTQPTLVGQLLYGVAGGNLISFDSGAPRNIRSAVNITGLPINGSQVLAGADFRPLTGELFALGYDATNQLGQLYTLNTTTGALTAVGSLISYPLGTNANNIGFDFNPTVDRIRITSATNQANLRANPSDGTYLVDGTLTNGALAPALAGVAYINNDNNPNTGTALYGYDQSTNFLLLSSNANAGTYGNVGSGSGITVNAANGVDFDVYSDLTAPATPVNSAFLTATPTGGSFDNLYTVNLAAGTATLVDRIGNGSNLSGVAALPTADANAITWTGNTDTDWGTASNWNPARVPMVTDNVTIPGGRPNQPTVSNAQQANALTLASGATLTTANGAVLSLNGNLVNFGGTLAGSGSGVVSFIGTTAQSITGTVSRFQNLTAANIAGVTAGGPVQVVQVLRATGNLASGGNVTLLSSSAGTALIAEPGAGQVTGNITVQRYIDPSLNAGVGYRHYGAPVTGTTVSDLATTTGFTPTVNPAYNTSLTPGAVTPFPTVFRYSQGRIDSIASNFAAFDRGWQSPSATTQSMAPGLGFSVNIAANQLVDFVGGASRGSVTISSFRGGNAAGGWALLANPYPAPFNLSLQPASDRTGFEAASYVFQSTSQYAGQYRSYVNGVGGNPILPVGQGFFKRVATANSVGTFTFNPNYRVTTFDATPFQRGTADTRPLVHLTLRATTGTLSDDAYVYFEQGATAGLDAEFDAAKFSNTTGLNLMSQAGTDRLAINGLPALGTADVVVPLLLEVAQTGTYLLNAPELNNLPAGTYAYLRDAQTSTLTDLAAQPSVSVSLTQGSTGRYSLLITQQRVLANASAQLAQSVAVFPNPTKGTVSVSLPAALANQEVAVTLVNALGQTVRRAVLPAGPAAAARPLALTGVAAGIYSLRLDTSAGFITKRLVIE